MKSKRILSFLLTVTTIVTSTLVYTNSVHADSTASTSTNFSATNTTIPTVAKNAVKTMTQLN